MFVNLEDLKYKNGKNIILIALNGGGRIVKKPLIIIFK